MSRSVSAVIRFVDAVTPEQQQCPVPERIDRRRFNQPN
jgi:hypothetical protein